MAIKTYRDLDAWKESMNLATDVYKVTRKFPSDEKYALTSQIRRAASSIPANIVEGHARHYRKEYAHHLSIARGSLAELETHLILANRLEYISREALLPVWDQLQVCGKLLNGLIKAIKP